MRGPAWRLKELPEVRARTPRSASEATSYEHSHEKISQVRKEVLMSFHGPSQEGQVVIPLIARKSLGIAPGDVIVIDIVKKRNFWR
jgi:hypothetical protein